MRRFLMLIAVIFMASCTALPDVAEPAKPSGVEPGYPELIPLGGAAVTSPAQDAAAQISEQELTARVAGLKARANRLRGFKIN